MKDVQRHKRRSAITLAIALAMGIVVPLFNAQPAAATDFDPNFILSDFDLTDGSALTRDGVQAFLNGKGGSLARARFETPFGVTKTAAEIIHDAGAFYRISQKYLLIRLQVEQSLVTDTSVTQYQYDWATGFAVCDSCSTDDPDVKKFKGFFNQVNWAAKQFRERYLVDLEVRGFTVSGWGPGITKTVTDWNGTHTVTPVNDATAALYTYTPHVYNANFNIWNLWNRWFARKFPDGSLLKNSSTGTYYLIEFSRKRAFSSITVVASRFDPRKALLASPEELAAYEDGPPISFPNYSLIQSPRGTIFLLVDGYKRGIASREAFRTIGFNPEEILPASWTDVNAYPDGPIIDLGSAYPQGALLRSATTGGITYVENGIRHPIWSAEIFRSRFRNRPIITVSQQEIDGYAAGDPILFTTGELVTSPGSRSVFFIANGVKRPIASREVFDQLGFSWANIVWTSDKALSIHTTGEPLTAD